MTVTPSYPTPYGGKAHVAYVRMSISSFPPSSAVQVFPYESMFGTILGPVLLVLPSGPCHPADIAHAARAERVRVLLLDIEIGGPQHDLRRTDVQRALLDLCLEPGIVASVHFATDCRSFSPLNAHLQLRPPHDPDGLACPSAFAVYVAQQNSMIALCATIATIMCCTDRGFTWENPPDLRAPPHLPWAWPEMGRSVASLWQTSWLVSLRSSFDLVLLHSAMCMFGSEYRKYFGLLMPRRYHSTFAVLDGRYCPGSGAHARHTPAHGVDQHGRSHASLAGRYPWRFNVFLIRRHARCAPSIVSPHAVDESVTTSNFEAASAELSDIPSSDDEDASSASTLTPLTTPVFPRQGLITDGPSMSLAVQGRIEQEAEAPPGFSSYRNLLPAHTEELLGAPLPAVRDMARRLAAVAAEGGHAPHPTRVQWDGRGDWRLLVQGAPPEPITLELLIGEARVKEWTTYLRAYQTAFDAIRAGQPVTDPGEFLVRESELPTWARPFVWEANESAAGYQPVTRSTRDTVFPGRQVDREKMREVADQLGWHEVDADICAQAFEGGCELRSHAPAHTTASWHHPGVQSHFSDADRIVRTERAEQWTRVSTSPLPFVPCTLSPRDVVMQERSRLEPNMELTVYDKPRVTHNLSKVLRALGGREHAESTNSAVPAAEKALPGMPTVQQYARAQAVCDLAAGVQHLHGCSERRLDRRFDHLVVHVDMNVPFDVDIRPGASAWSLPSPSGADTPVERAAALEKFSSWLFSEDAMALAYVQRARQELRSRSLGCTCAPADCHGHLLCLAANCSVDELTLLRRAALTTRASAAPPSDALFDSSLPPTPFSRPFRSQLYGIDMESAYCFLAVQKADHYANCYLWPDEEGVVRVHVSMRVTFGGSPWPQRFERVALLNCAWIQHVQAEFDATHPPPAASLDWVRTRRQLQREGRLPAGTEQLLPSGLEPFIDDANGRALSDLVSLPRHLAGISIGAAQTAAIGATPAHPLSRVSVHCRIAIHESRRLGWAVADQKTMCGDGTILLGAQLDTVVDRVRCPLVKRRWIIHAADVIRAELSAAPLRVDTALMARFTGRLTNLSQFFPELRLPLAVGYAISRVTWMSGDGRRRRALRQVHLRSGGRREEELLTLLDVATEVAQDDWGVPLAPARCFPSRLHPATLTLFSDASRADSDDGVGGFAFLPAAPGVVFVMSAAWPPDVKAALDRGGERRCVRSAYPHGTPMLSLPVAEVFGAIAVVAAIQALPHNYMITSIIAIGDCAPAASALSRLYSTSAQIRHLLAESRAISRSWLGVWVPREWNSDADRLSHPSQCAAVARDATAADLHVIMVEPPSWVFDMLLVASRLPMGTDDAEWRP